MNSFDIWYEGAKESLKALLHPIQEYSVFFSNFFHGFAVVGSMFLLLLVYSSIRYGKTTARLLKKPQTLAIAALMMALNIILGYYTLRLSTTLRIGFGFLTQPIVATLFGPLVSCMTGMIQDILCYLLNPEGGFLPTYTMCVGIAGMLYGMVLFRKPTTFSRVFFVKVLIIVVVNIFLNSIALAPTSGSGFIGILPARIVKNILLLPIQSILSYLVLKLVRRIQK